MEIGEGEIFGLAGQSGSGKSTFALALLGLLEARAQVKGSILFRGQELTRFNERDWLRLRGREIALIPQNPLGSLNPCLRLGTQFQEAWTVHRKDAKAQWRDEALRALDAASLPVKEDFLRRYPRELSVGMAQRVLIAMALLHRPRLILADEATSALDLITQAEILKLFQEINRTYGASLLFITHDLAAAAQICHRLAVLHQGEVVECGQTAQMFERPVHPYTRKLMDALPWRAASARQALQSFQ